MREIRQTGSYMKTGMRLRQENERSVNYMEDGRKKIRICLLVIVLAAVVIGVLYYLSTPQEQAGEGFLIRNQCEPEVCHVL